MRIKTFRLFYKIIFLSVFCFLTAQPCLAENLRIYCMDVEQGDATVIVTPANRAVVIDEGASNNCGALIYNLLQGLGITRIEYLISTHYDADHISGAKYLIDNIGSIGAAYDRGNPSSQTESYNRYKSALTSKGVPRKTISANPSTELKLDGVTIKCLCVNGRLLNGNSFDAGDENEKSIGILITFMGFDFLTLGDLLSSIEDPVGGMFHNGDIQNNIDIHHVSHHGSSTSSSLNFLNNIQPETAIISVGQNNYGHPGQATIENLKDADTDKIYMTNKGSYNGNSNNDGVVIANSNINIRTDGNQYWISTQGGREEHWMTDDSPPSYSISGCVGLLSSLTSSSRLRLYGLANVRVNLHLKNTGQVLASTLTDRNGYYRFYNIIGGESYTIKPSLGDGCQFLPDARKINPLSTDMENQDFIFILCTNFRRITR